MKNSKKTWGMLGTSMGSMLIIVALLTMVGMGSNDTYAARKICTCKNGTLDSAAQTCTYEKEVEYTCKKDTPGAYHCVAVGVLPTTDYDCTCKKTVPKTEPASCREIDDPGGEDDRYDPSEVNPDGSSTKPSTWKCASNQYKSGTSCKACPANATCDGISFSCPSEKYEKTGSGCTPKDPTDYEKSECDTVGEPCTAHGRTGTCTLTGGKKLCKLNSPSDGDDKPNKPTKPSGGDDDSGKNIGNCPAGTYYLGLNHAADCPSGYYCPGGTYNANTGDVISGCEKIACPANATCTSSSYTCNKGYHPSSGGCVKDGTSGGDDGSGGNGGGNSGGNTGGNGNGGNTGGNGNGGNNATKNPNTATKAPLVIAIIGIISVGISSVVYFKGKKEINTEI